MATATQQIPNNVNWGDIAIEEGPGVFDNTNNQRVASQNLGGSVPDYINAEPTVCSMDDTTMLTKTEAQRFAKLLWEADNVSIFNAASTRKPRLPICAANRSIPTEENVAHDYYRLLVRIGSSYDAICANTNYPESPFKENWYRVHVNRANQFYWQLVECVKQYAAAPGRLDHCEQFAAIQKEMAKPLPNLCYVN